MTGFFEVPTPPSSTVTVTRPEDISYISAYAGITAIGAGHVQFQTSESFAEVVIKLAMALDPTLVRITRDNLPPPSEPTP